MTSTWVTRTIIAISFFATIDLHEHEFSIFFFKFKKIKILIHPFLILTNTFHFITTLNHAVRRLITSVLCVLIISPSFWTQPVGDTITVQTLTFDDITKRRGWYVFPNDTNQYHKILMYYTLNRSSYNSG